ncbi:MAG: peptidase M61, partial [Flavobacteriia bacterium]|nr:peptidase M61 [Flavobacteriia bacterium]
QMNDSMSFTEMSENVLDEPYSKQYYNVYQKGALIGMCVDILMREGSNGQRGILSLMKELSNKYGKNKPFEDDKLFEDIQAMTYPSLKLFFDKHVIGTTPIDYNEFLNKVGLEINEGKVETNYIQNAGALIISGDGQKGTIFFTDLVLDNSFWVEQGVQPNDVIKEIDGEPMTLQNANQILQNVFMWKPGKDIEVKLDRNGEEIIIKTITTPSYTMGKGIMPKSNATQAEISLKEAWLKG